MKQGLRAVMIGILASFILLLPAYAATFSDVSEYSSYYDAVDYVTQRGIMAGYSEGTFKPDNMLTRGQISAILCRMIGENENLPVNGNIFSDVPASHWANGYITKAVSLGIINGFQDGTFRSLSPVTYNQALAMLIRAFGLRQEAENAGGYPQGYWNAANQYGLLEGVSTKGPSNKGIRRYEIAVIMYNYFQDNAHSYVPNGTEDKPHFNASESNGYTSIPKELVENDVMPLEGKNLPSVTFYQNGHCDITMNMAHMMDTFSAIYRVLRTNSGARIIVCDGSSDPTPRPIYFVETNSGWMYEGPQMGFTMAGGIFSPTNSEEIRLSGKEIDDSLYESYIGNWNGLTENDWPVNLYIDDISDGVITFGFSFFRGWGEYDLTAVMESDGVAYGWTSDVHGMASRVKLSFLGDSVQMEFYDIAADSMLGEELPNQNKTRIIFDQRGVY